MLWSVLSKNSNSENVLYGFFTSSIMAIIVHSKSFLYKCIAWIFDLDKNFSIHFKYFSMIAITREWNFHHFFSPSTRRRSFISLYTLFLFRRGTSDGSLNLSIWFISLRISSFFRYFHRISIYSIFWVGHTPVFSSFFLERRKCSSRSYSCLAIWLFIRSIG